MTTDGSPDAEQIAAPPEPPLIVAQPAPANPVEPAVGRASVTFEAPARVPYSTAPDPVVDNTDDLPLVRQPGPEIPDPSPDWSDEPDPFQARRTYALWGAVGSGKTVFLNALPAAVAGQLSVPGTWVATEDFDGVTSVQMQRSAEMALGGLLPGATFRGQENRHRWRLRGTVPRQASVWQSIRGWRPPDEPLDIRITMIDRGGGSFLDIGSIADVELSRLLNAHGFIYLFDPTLEKVNAKVNYRYFVDLMSALNQRYPGNLPQHIAVCVTKFDDERVFKASLDAGWINQDLAPPRQPRVLDEHAEEYFQWLCERFGTLDLYTTIKASFGGNRVRYYASSAFGFNLTHLGELHPTEFSTYEEAADGVTLKGTMNPINVAEPIINLDLAISRELA